jgi:hypothetical protein
MEQPTPSEKFEIAKTGVEALNQLARDIEIIGIGDELEHKAITILAGSLFKAMRILDTAEAKRYAEDIAGAYKTYLEQLDVQNKPTGQYL